MNNNIENKSSSIANTILTLGVLFGILVIIIGLTYISDYEKEILAVPYIAVGIGSIMSSVIVWSIISLLINISSKLDNKQATLCQHSIDEITKALKQSKKIESNDSVVNKIYKINKADALVTTSKVEKIEKSNIVNKISKEKIESIISEHESDSKFLLNALIEEVKPPLFW